MKICIDEDELYPFYDFETDSQYPNADVPEETVVRWEEVMEEWRKVQGEIQSYYFKRKRTGKQP